MKSSISVIISAYNASGTISACLESLVKQTIPIEIIVVDDGSSDNSPDIVEKYASVQLIKQTHQGVAAARNLGASKAKGDVLVFVDADMTFAPDFVENLIQPIIKDNQIGTFTKDESVSNWENPWARCWNIEYTGTKTKHRLPPSSPDTSPVFRAITKKAFASVGGFDRGGYDDDWSLSRKLKQSAAVAKNAKVKHRNPATPKEVFDHAVWVSTRNYKAGLFGKLIAFFRANPLFSVLLGMYKAHKFQESWYIPFKVIYNAGISWGLLKQMPWLVVVLALVLRLPLLNGSFWLDEAAQALESVRPLSQQFDIIPDFQPPLYHLVVHLLTYVSHVNGWLRLASLIPGVITIWLTYKLGRLLANQTVGLWATLFLATSQFHLFYSQELRPYALAAFFATWSMYELLCYIKHRRSHLWGLMLINTAGLYTMYLYPFFILSQFIYILLSNRRLLKQYIYATMVTIFLFLPWLPTFLKQLATGTGWLTSLPGWSTAVSPPILKMLPLTFTKLIHGRLFIDATLRDVILLGLWLFPVIALIKSWSQLPKNKAMIIWILIPVILAFIVSLQIPVLDPKRVMFILPAISLLLAMALAKIRHGILLSILILVLNSISVVRYWSEPINQREPWQTAIQAVMTEQASSQALVLFAFSEPFAPWRWYAPADVPTYSIIPGRLTEAELHARLSLFSGYDTMIVFDYLMDITDP
jgi:glycosyltransferase involved in cell wall biosynthesis